MTAMRAASAPELFGPGLPRLLAGVSSGGGPSNLDEHLSVYGQLPPAGAIDLPALVEASGLRGLGGAGFPTAMKLRAVAAQRGRPVVVANGTEGEPISGKDKVLVRYLPHLVLDGTAAAAHALGAREAIVAVSRADREGLAALSAAIAERGRVPGIFARGRSAAARRPARRPRSRRPVKERLRHRRDGQGDQVSG